MQVPQVFVGLCLFYYQSVSLLFSLHLFLVVVTDFLYLSTDSCGSVR